MIIKSILDTDLYKFSTSFAYMQNFPDAEGTFEFCDRGKEKYTNDFIEKVRLEVTNLNALRMTKEEFDFVTKTIKYIPLHYWEWLRSFQFNPGKVSIELDNENCLHISVTDKLYKVTLYETVILAIVSELRSRELYGYISDLDNVLGGLKHKIHMSNFHKILFSEFGMRRRYSYTVQDIVIKYIKENAKYCTGTSNVHFAMKYDMKPIGTHPHEWFMFHGAMFGYKMANYMALENWVNTYDGDLGIALTDTYTTDVFFKNFSKKHAKLFDGIRQDSGNEFEFIEKALTRYNELGINPMTKTIIFSNALNFAKAKDIKIYCEGKINAAFGIGTNLTNDIKGTVPGNLVMKLTKCRMNSKQSWSSCIKLSDDLGKHMGPEVEVKNCKYECNIC
jgi:nicotinate phosphoribosyltransferase